jgi:hypothetical protein
VLVLLGDGNLEPLANRLPALTRCEPAAHEVGSLSTRPDGVPELALRVLRPEQD